MTGEKCSMMDFPGPCAATLGTIEENDRLHAKLERFQRALVRWSSTAVPGVANWDDIKEAREAIDSRKV